jgi:tetratricopeptide (TPR) repeat protein
MAVLLAAVGVPTAGATATPAVLAPTNTAVTESLAAHDPGDTVTVEMPAGQRLAPGTYEVIVRGGGADIHTTVTVAAPGPPPAGQPTSHAGSSSTWLVGLASLVSVAFLGALYLLLSRPIRARRRYRELVGLVSQGKYREAIAGLSTVEATLPPGARADARFFLAFALYQYGELDEAEHRLAALHREHPDDTEVAYLLAYIRAERGEHDRAEQVLQTIEASGRLHVGQSRRLYGQVAYHRGVAALQDGKVDVAAQLFDKVRKLGDFSDLVPVDLRNRHIIVGTRALLDGDLDVARVQFQALADSSGTLDPSERDAAIASSKLGLALVAWMQSQPNTALAVEALLDEAAGLMDPAGARQAVWPPMQKRSLAERLVAATDDRHPGLRDVHLLRALSVLRAWAESEPSAAVASADIYLRNVLRRLARANELDPDMADPYLIVGLLTHQRATTPEERAESVELLREAQRLGVHDPYVTRIVNRHDQETGRARDALAIYLHALDTFRKDDTVRSSIQLDLSERLSRLGPLPVVDSRLPDDLPDDPAPMGTLDRCRLLQSIVEQMLATGPTIAGLTSTVALAHGLAERCLSVSQELLAIEQSEADLLVMVGDHLMGKGRG